MPKVILYMAVSLNGMIAKENDDTSWISDDEWEFYCKAARSAGNLIVGHRTYDIMSEQAEFEDLRDVRVVVIAHDDFDTKSANHSVVVSPKEALAYLKDEEQVIVAGGGILNAAFLQNKMVDEIFIDVEPVIFGKGIKLLNGDDFTLNLKLLGVTHISDNEVQLHYEVVK